MNKNKALKNIFTSIITKVILLILSLFLRRYLLLFLGQEAVGIYSLFISLIGFLSVIELGVGTAITFSLYKPIVENDENQISGLFYLYRKVYFIISFIILAIGIIISPFIPYFAKNETGTFSISLTFLLFLISTVTTYLYAHKTSFINAHMDNYITTVVKSTGIIIETILQIFILTRVTLETTNIVFILFFVIILASHLFQMFVTNIIFKRKYSNKVNNNRSLEPELLTGVVEKTKAMFLHKIGSVLVNATDSIIISSLISISILGIYNNYTLIATGVIGVLSLLFSSIISVLGHSFAKNGKKVFKNQFNLVYTMNFVLGFMLFLGYYMIIDDLIYILFLSDSNIILPKNITAIITVNYYIQFMRNSVLTFRDASGVFYNDRFKPILEGVINLLLSLILVFHFGIAGVLIATIFTNLVITHVIEPFVLYKYSFESSPKKYYLYNYGSIIVFIATITLIDIIPLQIFESRFINFLTSGVLSVVITLIVMVIIYFVNKDFKKSVNHLFYEGLRTIKSIFSRK